MCANKTGEFELKLKDNTIIIKEKEESWDNVGEKYSEYIKSNFGNINKSFIEWAKENYHPPIKK